MADIKSKKNINTKLKILKKIIPNVFPINP